MGFINRVKICISIVGLTMSLSTFSDNTVNMQVESTIDLNTFIELADPGTRCEAIDLSIALIDLEYALLKELITQEAFIWARQNGYTVALDRLDRVTAICRTSTPF